jgi:hypothetical protein
LRITMYRRWPPWATIDACIGYWAPLAQAATALRAVPRASAGHFSSRWNRRTPHNLPILQLDVCTPNTHARCARSLRRSVCASHCHTATVRSSVRPPAPSAPVVPTRVSYRAVLQVSQPPCCVLAPRCRAAAAGRPPPPPRCRPPAVVMTFLTIDVAKLKV